MVVGGQTPAEVQVWDWKRGNLLQKLSGIDVALCTALLPDGRLVVADWGGKIRVGKMDDWEATAVVTDSGATRLSGLAVSRDGSFVTASQMNGEIKLWKDGKCIATFNGGFSGDNVGRGNSLAVVGGRLLAAGKDNTVLVFE